MGERLKSRFLNIYIIIEIVCLLFIAVCCFGLFRQRKLQVSGIEIVEKIEILKPLITLFAITYSTSGMCFNSHIYYQFLHNLFSLTVQFSNSPPIYLSKNNYLYTYNSPCSLIVHFGPSAHWWTIKENRLRQYMMTWMLIGAFLLADGLLSQQEGTPFPHLEYH